MTLSLESHRILVTGGLGFIGSELTRLCRQRGLDVVAVAQEPEAADPGVIVADLLDPNAVDSAISGFDVVIHLAARAGGIVFQEQVDSDTFEVNRRITDNILRASRRAGVRRVFLASSAAIYRDQVDRLSEESPKVTVEDGPTQYAWSKITDEVAAGWYPDLDIVVGRFGNVYGPGAPVGTPAATVIHALIHRALGLQPGDEFVIWGDGTAIRSFIHVRDVASAILTIVASADRGAVFNVDTGEAVTIADVAGLIRDLVDPTLRLQFDVSKPAGVAMRVQDPSALRRLGFAPETSLPDGIRSVITWLRQQP